MPATGTRMTAPRPYAFLAELTYRCPLHCPYCSNPTRVRNDRELTTDEWCRVFREAAALGVLQIGFSGGEPLVRHDLAELVRGAREAKLYTNLITSGVGLDDNCGHELRNAGLDSVQLSFQSDEPDLADEIAGARAHQRKLNAAEIIHAAGISLSLNFVIHRRNIDRLPQMIELTEALDAERVELANVQFYGWAFLNRAALLPTREQIARAREVATAAKARLAGKIDIFYVLPDYYETWMPEPCRSCPQKEIDFGGCRCQAALLTGNAANTDPVCTLSPNRAYVDALLRDLNSSSNHAPAWIPRLNPKKDVIQPEAGCAGTGLANLL